MTRFIDDEAEGAARLKFSSRHEKPPLLDLFALTGAENGHHLDDPWLMAGGPGWSGRPWIASHSSGHLSRIVRSASFRS